MSRGGDRCHHLLSFVYLLFKGFLLCCRQAATALPELPANRGCSCVTHVLRVSVEPSLSPECETESIQSARFSMTVHGRVSSSLNTSKSYPSLRTNTVSQVLRWRWRGRGDYHGRHRLLQHASGVGRRVRQADRLRRQQVPLHPGEPSPCASRSPLHQMSTWLTKWCTERRYISLSQPQR